MFQSIQFPGNIIPQLTLLDPTNPLIHESLIFYQETQNQTHLLCFCSRKDWVVLFLEPLETEWINWQFGYAAYSKSGLSEGLRHGEKRAIISVLLGIGFQNRVFLEIRKRRNSLRQMVTYTSVEELQTYLYQEFGSKFVIPFFYNRDMKEYQSERKRKVKELGLLYILEYKSLEGKKR
jgi:hypothetical protein